MPRDRNFWAYWTRDLLALLVRNNRRLPCARKRCSACERRRGGGGGGSEREDEVEFQKKSVNLG